MKPINVIHVFILALAFQAVGLPAMAQTPVIDSVFAASGRLEATFPFTVTEVVTGRLVEMGSGSYLGIGSAVVPGFEIGLDNEIRCMRCAGYHIRGQRFRPNFRR